MLGIVIKVPKNFSLTVGWMCLWWTALRMLFLFILNSWLSLLEASVNSMAPFLHYIYGLFLSDKNSADDSVGTLLTQLKKLISVCFYLLCVDAVFQISLIYASNKKSFMLMLPWILYSFMTLIIFTLMPLDYYSRKSALHKTENGKLEDSGLMYALDQMTPYFIYLTIQLILLLIVFNNFQNLRFNKSYYYLKNAIDIENKMFHAILDLYDQSIFGRFQIQCAKHGIVVNRNINAGDVNKSHEGSIENILITEKEGPV